MCGSPTAGPLQGLAQGFARGFGNRGLSESSSPDLAVARSGARFGDLG